MCVVAETVAALSDFQSTLYELRIAQLLRQPRRPKPASPRLRALKLVVPSISLKAPLPGATNGRSHGNGHRCRGTEKELRRRRREWLSETAHLCALVSCTGTPCPNPWMSHHYGCALTYLPLSICSSLQDHFLFEHI
ncbi:hypothetical protein MTO96_044843 [Rhipicephalus appendiculatus]